MKKKNLFDLLALKEKVNSNKYLQKLTPLKEEKIKVLKILDQLAELKENKNSKKSLSAWELKSSSNIQEKIFDQISLAKSRINQVDDEILLLEKKFIEHEIRKKRSLEKSRSLKDIKNLEQDKKNEAEIQSLKRANLTSF